MKSPPVRSPRSCQDQPFAKPNSRVMELSGFWRLRSCSVRKKPIIPNPKGPHGEGRPHPRKGGAIQGQRGSKARQRRSLCGQCNTVKWRVTHKAVSSQTLVAPDTGGRFVNPDWVTHEVIEKGLANSADALEPAHHMGCQCRAACPLALQDEHSLDANDFPPNRPNSIIWCSSH